MSLQDQLTASFEVATSNTVVKEYKKQALEAFTKNGFPTTKDEEWKYTSLRNVLKGNFQLNTTESTVTADAIVPYLVTNDSYKVVFVSGKFQPALSVLPNNVTVETLEKAFESEIFAECIQNQYNSLAKGFNSMVDLNTALAINGVAILVAKNTVVDKPIELLYVNAGTEEALFSQTRNLIVVGANADVKIIETYQSLTENATFNNVVTEVFVGANAQVDIYKVQNDTTNATMVDATFIAQERDTVVGVYTFTLGGQLVRNNLAFYQNGTNCESNLNGVTILEGEQLVDNHTLVSHLSPDCTSNETYKGIYGGKSTGVFNGKVIVDQKAQRINAYQQNDSVLISDEAAINSKPQLEIFADDVKCSHGCTIGQLDKSALFYMQQRGIPKKEAEALLMFAFCADALKDIKIDALKIKLNQLMADKLGVHINFNEVLA